MSEYNLDSGYHNKEGDPITCREWGKLFKDIDYRIIGNTQVNDWLISTVWLGIDHRFCDEKLPIIFESMIFKDGESIDMQRYATLAEAEEGHLKLVKEYEGKTL